MKLTDSQRRHLTVHLAQVEDALESLERFTADRKRQRVYRSDHTDLPEGFGPANRADLAEIQSTLAELARTLHLEPLEHSRAQDVLALVTIAIVQLEDAGSRGLRGYGEVDPELPAVLDPALGRLRGLLARVAGRLSPQDRDAEAPTS